MVGLDQVAIHLAMEGSTFWKWSNRRIYFIWPKATFGKGFMGNFTQQIGKASVNLIGICKKAGFFYGKFSTGNSRFYRESAENEFFKYKDLGQAGTPEVSAENSCFSAIRNRSKDLPGISIPTSQAKTSFWVPMRLTERSSPWWDRNTMTPKRIKVSGLAVGCIFTSGQKSILNLKTGLIRDNQVFNQSINSTSQYFLSGDWDATLSSKWESQKLRVDWNFYPRKI